MQLKLLVIRTPNLQALAEFYTVLGFTPVYHKHGQSPYHYSIQLTETVLEIYPLAKEQPTADKHLRLGFEIERFDEVIARLKEKGLRVISEPVQTAFGFMAVVEDPDGRKTELYRKDQS